MTTCVVKYGGSVRDETSLLLEEIAYFSRSGVKIAIVHGGGPEISGWLSRIGHSSSFLDGQRVTDETTLDVVEMVLGGRVGKRIVRQLQGFGVQAVSISGEDGGLIEAVTHEAPDLGRVGRVAAVNPRLVHHLLDAGYVPVIAPLGLDSSGRVLNINADAVAGALAGALAADAFLLATDVAGVKESPHSLHAIPQLTADEAMRMIADKRAVGGMIPKIAAAVAAVEGGARDAYITDGTMAGILEAVLRKEAIGTRIGTTR